MDPLYETPQEPIRSTAEEPAGIEYVSFWPRAGARIIDTLVHFAVGFVVGIVLVIISFFVQGLTGARDNPFLASLQDTPWSAYVFAILGSMAYHAATESIHGSSLGKRLLGITVYSEKGPGCSLLQGIKRSVAFLVDSFFFGAVGAHFMSESPKQMRLGDQWANTVVVKIRSLPPSERGKGLEFIGALVAGMAADGVFLASGHVLGYVLR